MIETCVQCRAEFEGEDAVDRQLCFCNSCFKEYVGRCTQCGGFHRDSEPHDPLPWFKHLLEQAQRPENDQEGIFKAHPLAAYCGAKAMYLAIRTELRKITANLTKEGA